MRRSVVDLPQPDGPSSATRAPAGAEKLTPSTAAVAPQNLATLSSRIVRPARAPRRRGAPARGCGSGPGLALAREGRSRESPSRAHWPTLLSTSALQEALDDEHEQDRRHEQDQRRDRGDLVVAAHAGVVEQERQGRHLRHADEEGAGELVERFQKHEDRARHDAGRGERQGHGGEGARRARRRCCARRARGRGRRPRRPRRRSRPNRRGRARRGRARRRGSCR